MLVKVLLALTSVFTTGCTAEKSDIQTRRDMEAFIQARDLCLREISKVEAQPLEMIGVPHSAANSGGEGRAHRMNIAYKLPGATGPAQFSEADCVVEPGQVAQVTLKH